jgi:glutaredoxin-related protein
MIKIASINKNIQHTTLKIDTIEHTDSLNDYDYVIISGGDGAIRRAIKTFINYDKIPKIIINPVGSFNVIAKTHQPRDIQSILDDIASNKPLSIKKQKIYTLNDEIFLFSAGNMGDLQHIFISETIRIGWLKKGAYKYIITLLLLLPMHLILTPFMLLSKQRFFVFTPLKFIKKFGSFYGQVNNTIHIDLQNNYNFIELDGDIVTIYDDTIKISYLKDVDIVV